jgi:hypothetical protein
MCELQVEGRWQDEQFSKRNQAEYRLFLRHLLYSHIIRIVDIRIVWHSGCGKILRYVLLCLAHAATIRRSNNERVTTATAAKSS